MRVDSYPRDTLPPYARVNLQAGPSKVHQFSDQLLSLIQQANQQNHRGEWTKKLLKNVSDGTFELLGIPEEQRNTEWHICYTNSGTDGMERAIRAVCPREGTLFVDTDEFSTVVGKEMKDFGRGYDVMKFTRGMALTPDAEEFEAVAQLIRNNEIKTLYLTRNGTTTGTDQKEAIEALVKVRDESGSDVVIVVDEVSAQWWAASKRTALPDIIFVTSQKDMAIGPGTGLLIFNNRALERAQECAADGLDTGGKLGITAAYGTSKKRMAAEGQTAQTPPLGMIYAQHLVQDRVLRGAAQQEIRAVQGDALRAITSSIHDGALGELGFGMLTTDDRLQSPTAHVLTVPDDLSGSDIVRGLRERHSILLSPGYGDFQGREVRVCSYSAIAPGEVREAIDAMVALVKVMRSGPKTV